MTDRPSSSHNRSGGGSCRSGTWRSHSLHRPWLWLASISAGANEPSYPARSVITSRTRIGVPLPGGIWRLMEARFVTNYKKIKSLRRLWRLLAVGNGLSPLARGRPTGDFRKTVSITRGKGQIPSPDGIFAPYNGTKGTVLIAFTPRIRRLAFQRWYSNKGSWSELK